MLMILSTVGENTGKKAPFPRGKISKTCCECVKDDSIRVLMMTLSQAKISVICSGSGFTTEDGTA
eukprot:c33637_g1_i1 orf=1-192(-)